MSSLLVCLVLWVCWLCVLCHLFLNNVFFRVASWSLCGYSQIVSIKCWATTLKMPSSYSTHHFSLSFTSSTTSYSSCLTATTSCQFHAGSGFDGLLHSWVHTCSFSNVSLEQQRFQIAWKNTSWHDGFGRKANRCHRLLRKMRFVSSVDQWANALLKEIVQYNSTAPRC